MQTSELKQRFNIKPCQNKLRTVWLGKLMLGVIFSSSNTWCSLTNSGNKQTDYFSVSKVESIDGYGFYRLVIWKLNLTLAWAK